MLEFRENRHWTNKHGTVTQVATRIAYATNVDERGVRREKQAWRVGCDALSEVVRAAESARVTLAPLGSAWSLSEVHQTLPGGWLVETAYLNEIPCIGLNESQVAAGSTLERNRLVYAQGGNTISRLHTSLAPKQLALRTSGASCGQTLAGAISTGTHGAAVRFGALQEMVRGVHMIVTNGEPVWIEPQSRPAVSEAWCAELGARLIRDDDIFAAALVSFGTMGLVHAYLLEVEPMYLLRGHCRRMPLGEVYAGVTRSADAFETTLATAASPDGTSELAHFSVSIDPNAASDDCVVKVLFKERNSENHVPRFDPAAPLTMGDDAIIDVARLMAGCGRWANSTIRRESAKLLDSQANDTRPLVGALCELFPQVQFLRGGTSTEIGVDVNDWSRAVKLILRTIRARQRAFPGILSLRFVRGSSQRLAVTRFPVTCTIELPMAQDKQTLPLFKAIWKVLAAEGITFTLHWGQASRLGPGDLGPMYGDENVSKWKQARARLLGTGATTFANALSSGCGLTEKPSQARALLKTRRPGRTRARR